jgi:hypothetical protein
LGCTFVFNLLIYYEEVGEIEVEVDADADAKASCAFMRFFFGWFPLYHVDTRANSYFGLYVRFQPSHLYYEEVGEIEVEVDADAKGLILKLFS